MLALKTKARCVYFAFNFVIPIRDSPNKHPHIHLPTNTHHDKLITT